MKASRRRVVGVAAALALGATGLAGVASCILVDPPPQLPKAPSRHPSIIRARAVPAADRPLGEVPQNFTVPVQVPDPTRDYEWRVFVDFDPLRNAGYVLNGFGVGSAQAADTQSIEFGTETLGLASSCHRLELVVALGFDPSSDHAADANGSDSITWFYTPSGNLAGCTTYDAGSDGPNGMIPVGDAEE